MTDRLVREPPTPADQLGDHPSGSSSTDRSELDPREAPARLMRDLRTSATGLTDREVRRRLERYGPNQLEEQTGQARWHSLAHQFTHPLALLLLLASVLAVGTGSVILAVAILVVVLLNAGFAFLQEQQAERAVEALQSYLPAQATVRRDGSVQRVAAADLVPGDVLIVAEGDRISADARMLTGSVEVDTSMLTGEADAVERSATLSDLAVPYLHAPDLLFSGTTCLGGEATAVVHATGMHTELGRIAALSTRQEVEQSPLERQVRRIAWVIALVALAVGAAFLPLGMFAAGLSFPQAAIFAVGLLVANVPEGLLPTITLALAAGVRILARRGAIVKRLSAVETLGSTTVICTDKTGTLTENRMRAVAVATSAGLTAVEVLTPAEARRRPDIAQMARAVVACNNATLDRDGGGIGDPTEIALLRVATPLVAPDADPSAARIRTLAFDPDRRLMSTIDREDGRCVVHTKGAPEAVLDRCVAHIGPDGEVAHLDATTRARFEEMVDELADQGLRVLGVASRTVDLASASMDDASREDVERDLCLLGLIALEDPPRPEVPAAVRRCQSAGVRVVMVTGDHEKTAAAIARRVGLGGTDPYVVTGDALESLSEDELDDLLGRHRELVFARVSPEAKLRIADALRELAEVVAMTGDGVNDAPALRRADIGVAMGLAGTDVAREAATMILTDDNFATIAVAIEEGRRVYANIRKFIFYIFVHATPEVVPFLVYALSAGAVPLPLTVLQILAIDLGTEILPALALGREPAEPGLMEQPPRPPGQGVIRPAMLVRAWLFLGVISAALVLAGFFAVLRSGGWQPGDPTGVGTALHETYRQATTMTFLGIVMCQVGTVFAARTERVSLRSIGITSNRLLIWAVGIELAFALAVTYLGPLQRLFGTASLEPRFLLWILPFPLIVWGADELARWVRRSTTSRHGPPTLVDAS